MTEQAKFATVVEPQPKPLVRFSDDLRTGKKYHYGDGRNDHYIVDHQKPLDLTRRQFHISW
jgi:hypothetical protein